MSARTRAIGPPRLTIETGTTVPLRTMLRPDPKSSREVMSGCRLAGDGEERFYGDRSEAANIVEESAQDRLDYIEEYCRGALARAEEHDVKARTARGMHIKRHKEDAEGYRKWAEEIRHPQPLPRVSDETRPFVIYTLSPREYPDTLQITAYDAAGFQILSQRVTGSTSVRASAFENARELIERMEADAAAPKLALVQENKSTERSKS